MTETFVVDSETQNMIEIHNQIVEFLDEDKKSQCRISKGDGYSVMRDKCARAYGYGAYYYPLVTRVLTTTHDDTSNDGDSGGGGASENVEEAQSSTERVRKYYKRHPEKVKQYLKKTVKDRSARNRDRAKAVKKHGKSKMRNHDVHHPNGPSGGSWRLAKKDHGPDKKNESCEPGSSMAAYVVNPVTKRQMMVASGLSYPIHHPAHLEAKKYLNK
jgi:hypothetical protein